MSIMKFSKTIIKNLFSRPATRLYPFVKNSFTDRTRGNVVIDINACIFCGICEKKCPSGALKVVKDNKSWAINRFGCIQCSSCVELCPKKCLSMNKEYTAPSEYKTVDVFTKDSNAGFEVV